MKILQNLTVQSTALFMILAEDAGNWSGTPMLDISKSERGNLTDLKVKGLLNTFDYNNSEFVRFTDSGIELAKYFGIEI